MRNARSNGHRSKAANSASDAMPFDANAEWVQHVVEGQAGFCVAMCTLTARRLRAQAELLEELARGHGAPDLLDRHTRLFWSSWEDCAHEADRLRKTWFEPLQNLPASQPAAGKRVSA